MKTLAFVLVAAAAAAEPDFSWMSGYWLACEGREVSETWSDLRAEAYFGSSVSIANGKLFFEYARIAPSSSGAGVSFYAQPLGQPGAEFPLKEVSDRRAVFENAAHDFPTRVIYAREGKVLVGRIEGVVDGEAVSDEWRYRRAKLNARCK